MSIFQNSEKKLIIIASMIMPFSLVFIYLISRRLASLSFEPLIEANAKLKTYNHNLAHELKNPLSIIKTDLELAKLERSFKKIDSALEENKNIEEIINSLLFLTEITNK